MTYAIVQFGGKQFKISEGDTLELERQSELNFDVLMYVNDNKVLLGEPYLKDVKVEAEVVDEKRGKKIRVARFKSKSRYRRVKGHRQPLSVVRIVGITVGAIRESPVRKGRAKKEESPVRKKVGTRSRASKKGSPKKEVKGK